MPNDPKLDRRRMVPATCVLTGKNPACWLAIGEEPNTFSPTPARLLQPALP